MQPQPPTHDRGSAPRDAVDGVTLGALLEDLAGLFVNLTPDNDGLQKVRRVEFYEPATVSDYHDALVLVAVPVNDRFELARVLEDIGAASAVAFAGRDGWMLGLPHSTDQPAILLRSSWIGWAETHLMANRVLEAHTLTHSLPLPDDLTQLAASVATLTGTAITIEDADSNVVAYSPTSVLADPVRVATILNRAVPASRVSELHASGLLRAVRHTTDVIDRPATAESPARMVVAIRAGEHFIGTMWSAYSPDIDRAKLREALRAGARSAYPLLLRALHRSTLERRLHDDSLRTILTGSGEVTTAAARLMIPAEHEYAVVCVLSDDADTSETILAVTGAYPEAHSVRIHQAVFHLVPVATPVSEDDIRRRITSRMDSRIDVAAGISRIIDHVTDGHAAADEALAVAQALRHRHETAPFRSTDETPASVATRASVADAAALAEAAMLLQRLNDAIDGPLRVLEQHDAKHGTDLVLTLRGTLAAGGNIAAAARALQLHSNSLRYRLSRIQDVAGIDLTDPDCVARTQLALYVVRARGDRLLS